MPRQTKAILAELPQAERIDVPALARALEDGSVELVCVLGPTASGKTRYAVRLAEELHLAGAGAAPETVSLPLDPTASGSPSYVAEVERAFTASIKHACGPSRRAIARRDGTGFGGSASPGRVEIISADSRQVYRGMDIGTGKDLAEYGDVPYHLIDIADPGDGYNVFRFKEDFDRVYADIRRRGGIPLLCGGTGMYINAVTAGYDFESRQPLSSERQLSSGPKTFFIGTLVSREVRNARIDARLDARLKEGMVEEIRGLLDSGVPEEVLLGYGLEYKFVTLYLKGELSFDEMRLRLATAIHQFAKRQMTWFRGMERSGVTIHWTEV